MAALCRKLRTRDMRLRDRTGGTHGDKTKLYRQKAERTTSVRGCSWMIVQRSFLLLPATDRCAAILPGTNPLRSQAEVIHLPSKMMEDQNHMTEKIWGLALEVICLLTGETLPVMSSDHVTMAVSPPPSWTLKGLAVHKILEISNKITKLLNGETGAKTEELVEEASGHTGVLTVGPSGCPATSESPSLGEYGDGAAMEETGVRKDELCMKEESSPIIAEDSSAATLLGASSEEPRAGLASLSSKMMVEQSHMTEKIWSLTLELICLLTEQTFPVMSGDHVTMALSAPPSWTLKRLAMQRILEISNKITELLTGEEERECLEDHGDIYTDTKMEDQPIRLSLERNLQPLYSQDSTQTGFKEEELVEEASDHTGVIIKVETSSCAMTPERPLLSEDGDEVQETVVKADEQCMEEESSLLIVCQHGKRDIIHPKIISDCKIEDETVENMISSAKCGKNNSQKLQLLRHERVNTEKKFSCSECGMLWSYKSQLVKHERVHSGVKPYSCNQCGKCFSRKENLTKHESTHTGEKPYSCSDCGKCFSRKSNLITHKRGHAGERPSRQFPCRECGKCFYRKEGLVKHERVHTGEKPYFCSECGKCFSQKSDLTTHQSVHTGVKPFSCTECGMSFSRKANLIAHERVHTGEKTFSCTECGKGFFRKTNLIAHARVHTGEKPFCCTVCGKYFTRKEYLIKHERVHTGERPYCCTICWKTFSQKSNLTLHERVHAGEKPYSCSECGKGFSSTSDLVRHERVHTREKPHSCMKCGNCFSTKSELVKHKRVHTKDKSYSCAEMFSSEKTSCTT